VDFTFSPKTGDLAASLEEFMRELVDPADAVYRNKVAHAAISTIKVTVPQMAARMIDRVHRTVVAKLVPHKYAGR
jgi:hypothetical protein